MSLKSTELLEIVVRKLDKLRENEKEDGLNIIGILGKESDEVAMCRVLWAILDQGKKGHKDVLASFLKDVLAIEVDASELEHARVYREYCIPQNGRRIDLVIMTANLFIPIEAKINAGDQANQCADYLAYAGNYYSEPEKAVLYYLTKDKHTPSYSSISNNQELLEQIRLVSWKKVLDWLRNVEGLEENLSETISQYCKALDNLLQVEKGDFNMEVDNLINSSDDIRAAMEIEKSLGRKKTALLHLIYDEVLDRSSNETELAFDPSLDEQGDYKQAVGDYYSKKKSSCPGLSFILGTLESLDDGTKYYLVLRYEIDWRSYVGLKIMKRDKNGQVCTIEKPTEELIDKTQIYMRDTSQLSSEGGCWLYWEYVCSNSSVASENEPDFKGMNGAYLALFDDDGRKEYIDQVIALLKKFETNIK